MELIESVFANIFYENEKMKQLYFQRIGCSCLKN